MSVSACIVKHLSPKSTISAYRADMAEDVADLVAGGMDSQAAWAKVVDEKLVNLQGEMTRVETTVAEAYGRTPAGKKTEGKITQDAVRAAVERLGVKVTGLQVRQSNTEPTAILSLDRPLTPDEGDKLSKELRQEAIVQRYEDGSGDLFGPEADEWGPFNPEYFLDAEEEAVASAKRGKLDPEIVQTLGKHIRSLTPDERAKLRKDTARKLVATLQTLPAANEVAAVAWAGRAKKGWYENSAKAIEHVFGGDGPRFAALLAALSPQTSVEANLYNTLATWKNWVAAGRPTDRASIVGIMGRSVQGSGTEDSVLDAWKNNAVRALSAEDPSKVVISGPKVNSFMLNLRGVVDEVTNDAWMANYALVDQKIFSGRMNAAGTDPGKTPGYMAMSARVREAARILTKETGQTWTPAEVQETVWSWAKTLYESASVDRSARDIINNDELNNDLIRATPDFRVLFHEDVNEQLLRDAGLGDQVDSLRSRSDLGDAIVEGPDAGGQAGPFARDAQKRYELAGAKRLDKLRQQRLTTEDPAVVASAKRTAETPEFQRWFGDSQIVDNNGEPLVVYHGTGQSFDSFTKGRSNYTAASSVLGYYFTNDSGVASLYAKETGRYGETGQNVVPAYLSIKNPRYEPEDTIADIENNWSVDQGSAWLEQLKKQGYDGIIFGDFDEIVAFRPEQIKSATGNNGAFDPNDPSIVKSDKRVFHDSGRAYTPEQLKAMERVGGVVEEQSLRERLSLLKQDWQRKLRQGLVDQFAPIQDLGDKGKAAYALARLSKGASGAVEALLHHGKLKLTADGVYDADQSGGAMQRLFAPLGRETGDFLRWIAAQRAERLAAEDRENLFAPADIAALKGLEQGTLNFDYTLQHGPRAGQTTRDRTLVYRDAQKTFNEFQSNVLQMAEQSGLIDADLRRLFENAPYVPFYREADDGGGFVGASLKDGLVKQKAFQRLKGGTNKLHSDLLANVLLNWSHLVDASAKNRAAVASLEAATDMGVAHRVPAASKGTVWVMRKGSAEHYAVDDALTLKALTSLSYNGLNGWGWDMLTAPKRWLTIGVTASPAFKVRNLIRDSMQAVAVTDLSPNILKNLKQGWEASAKDSQTYVSALAGGGLIRFGTMLEGRQADRVRQMIKQANREGSYLDSESALRRFYDTKLEPAIAAYNEVGNRGEEVNRSALYAQLKQKGFSDAEANLAARDMMDFSMMGAWGAVRFLTQTVPFLNARIQGLYKLGRGAAENPRRFAAVLGAVALASVALMAAYSDDDDFRKREDWDRNTNWWFKFGGVVYRIPKPFEIGAIATLAERGIEFAFNPDMTGKRYAKNVKDIILDNLSMNPVPQAVKPIIDLYANKDSFTGRPIEGQAMQRLRPELRYSAGTSMTARGLSAATSSTLSPVQVDHLIQGYFSWLGSFVLFVPEMIMREASSQPERPARDLYKFATQGIVQERESGSSYYVTALYDKAAQIEKDYASYRQLVKEGKLPEAAEFFKDRRDTISKYKSVSKVKAGEGKLAEMIRMVERSGLDADEKKTRIIRLREQQDRLARTLTSAAR